MRERLLVAGVVAGVAAVAVLAVLILNFGRFDPSPPSLISRPIAEIPGEILYINDHDCIVRAQASGAGSDVLYCGGPSMTSAGWLEDGRITFVTSGPGMPTLTTLDPDTGTTSVSATEIRWRQPDPVSVQGDRIDYDRDGSIFRVRDGERTKIFDFDGSEYQRPGLVTWSPDGNWLLLSYRDQLWIVSNDGRIAGTLTRSVREWSPGASWRIEGVGFTPQIGETPAGR